MAPPPRPPRPWGAAGPGPAEALAVLGVLVASDLAAARLLPPLDTRPALLWATAALRALQGFGCLLYWRGARRWSFADLGLTGPRAGRGWRVGAAVAAGVGVLVLAVEGVARLAAGASLLRWVSPAPTPAAEALALCVAGGVVAPVTEELVFRGILYAGLRRRWGPLPSTLLVAGLFALAHRMGAPVPWAQAVGGLLFCAAYEWSRSLWAPLLVHTAGNLAIFSLPLWLR